MFSCVKAIGHLLSTSLHILACQVPLMHMDSGRMLNLRGVVHKHPSSSTLHYIHEYDAPRLQDGASLTYLSLPSSPLIRPLSRSCLHQQQQQPSSASTKQRPPPLLPSSASQPQLQLSSQHSPQHSPRHSQQPSALLPFAALAASGLLNGSNTGSSSCSTAVAGYSNSSSNIGIYKGLTDEWKAGLLAALAQEVYFTCSQLSRVVDCFAAAPTKADAIMKVYGLLSDPEKLEDVVLAKFNRLSHCSRSLAWGGNVGREVLAAVESGLASVRHFTTINPTVSSIETNDNGLSHVLSYWGHL